MEFSDLIYRTVDLGGHAGEWMSVPDDRFILLPSPEMHNPHEIVVRVEFGVRPPWPGPGWYGPDIAEGQEEPNELRWCAKRGEVPEGWMRWALHIPGLRPR